MQVRSKAHDEAAAAQFRIQELTRKLESLNESMDRMEDQNGELEASVSKKREERDAALDKAEALQQEVTSCSFTMPH